MQKIIGLIPAAGKGLRLGLPYPKELYPIIEDNRYKPVSQFVLENLVAAGVQHIVFVINESKHQLIGYYGNGSRFGCQLSYVVQEQSEGEKQSTSPGLAHALNSAYHLVRDQIVCFGMADTIMRPRPLFQGLIEAVQQGNDVALGLFPTGNPQKFGMVDLAGDGRVLRIVDKPAKTHLTLMWGCMVWGPRFTEHLKECLEAGELKDFARIMNRAIEANLRVCGLPIDGSYTDLGTYEEIQELEKRYRAP